MPYLLGEVSKRERQPETRPLIRVHGLVPQYPTSSVGFRQVSATECRSATAESAAQAGTDEDRELVVEVRGSPPRTRVDQRQPRHQHGLPPAPSGSPNLLLPRHSRPHPNNVVRRALSFSNTMASSDAWKAAIRSRSAGSDAPRIRTASSPALRAPPMDTVATGTPAGI